VKLSTEGIMKHTIIGREEQINTLEHLFLSQKPEFLAVYGRRRIGKTFLIKQFFQAKKALLFSVTGEKDASMKKQIKHFTTKISETFYHGANLTAGKNWDETFAFLTKSFHTVDKDKKIILFFDEFPWMATPNANLLQNLDYYWN
jgi:AAA+ ATPase superfamily predicted ATPase